jgi:preprotein translocase subunit SecY
MSWYENNLVVTEWFRVHPLAMLLMGIILFAIFLLTLAWAIEINPKEIAKWLTKNNEFKR